MATASTARLLSGEAPKAADIARADTDLTSLEEGRGLSSSPALDEPLRMSSLRSTNGDSDRPGTSQSCCNSGPVDQGKGKLRRTIEPEKARAPRAHQREELLVSSPGRCTSGLSQSLLE